MQDRNEKNKQNAIFQRKVQELRVLKEKIDDALIDNEINQREFNRLLQNYDALYSQLEPLTLTKEQRKQHKALKVYPELPTMKAQTIMNAASKKEETVRTLERSIESQESRFKTRLQALIKLFEELKTARDNETTKVAFNQAIYNYISLYERTAKEFSLTDQKTQLKPYQIEDANDWQTIKAAKLATSMMNAQKKLDKQNKKILKQEKYQTQLKNLVIILRGLLADPDANAIQLETKLDGYHHVVAKLSKDPYYIISDNLTEEEIAGITNCIKMLRDKNQEELEQNEHEHEHEHEHENNDQEDLVTGFFRFMCYNEMRNTGAILIVLGIVLIGIGTAGTAYVGLAAAAGIVVGVGIGLLATGGLIGIVRGAIRTFGFFPPPEVDPEIVIPDAEIVKDNDVLEGEIHADFHEEKQANAL